MCSMFHCIYVRVCAATASGPTVRRRPDSVCRLGAAAGSLRPVQVDVHHGAHGGEGHGRHPVTGGDHPLRPRPLHLWPRQIQQWGIQTTSTAWWLVMDSSGIIRACTVCTSKMFLLYGTIVDYLAIYSLYTSYVRSASFSTCNAMYGVLFCTFEL